MDWSIGYTDCVDFHVDFGRLLRLPNGPERAQATETIILIFIFGVQIGVHGLEMVLEFRHAC